MTIQKFREPTRLILTDEGSSYFIAQNQRLQRFRLHDGREDFGLQLSDYTPSSLQKMIASGMVRKLEFPVVDSIARRHVVIDYIKLIQYGMLYLHARHGARRQALSSSLAEHWNRRKPRTAIGSPEVTPIMRALFTERSRDLEQARTLLEMRVRSIYSSLLRESEHTIDRSEREKAQRTARRLIEYLPGEVWFLWLLYQHEEEGRRYVQELASSIAHTLRYTTIADYLALLIVELMVHMQHRERETDSRADVLYLLTQFSVPPTRVDRGTRTHYLLSTGTMRFEALKADLEEVQRSFGGRKRSIEQFYQAVDAGEANPGLYYTSFLKEACEQVGASFESFARGDGAGGSLNLVLTI